VTTGSATAPVIAILCFGTLVRSSLGFGEALIAVPLLALFMPVEQAAPVAVLVSITIALAILIQDWRKVHYRSAWRLILWTLLGIPVGLLLLKTLPEAVVKGILALVIIGFAFDGLRNRHRRTLEDDRLAWLFGFHAGVLGGAYGMNGPPLAMYGSLRRWQPEFFRATLQAYFLPASLAGMGGYWFAGLWTPMVTHYFVVSLPGVVLAVLAGRMINNRMHPQRFTSYVYGGLTLIGVVLLVQSLTLWMRTGH
jgi:uncharacterized membrane protein YfcA